MNKEKIYNNFLNLNFNRVCAEQKLKARDYIISTLDNIYNMNTIHGKSSKCGVFKFNCYNLESENPDYEILLTAHYMKKNIIKYLKKTDIPKSDKVKIANLIINILTRLTVYILTGVVYALLVVTLTVDTFYDFLPFQFVTIQNQIYIIVTLLLMDKAFNILTMSIQKIFDWMDDFSRRLAYLGGHVLALVLLIEYIYLLNHLNTNYVGVNFIFFNVIIIIIYQKCINRLILWRLLINFDKYVFNIDQIDLIVKLHKNSNYIYLIVVTMISYMNNIFDSMLSYAITIVFLFDTYHQNHKKISTKIIK